MKEVLNMYILCLVTFSLLRQTTRNLKVKEGKFIAAQFVGVSVHIWLAAKPSGTAEGHWKEKAGCGCRQKSSSSRSSSMQWGRILSILSLSSYLLFGWHLLYPQWAFLSSTPRTMRKQSVDQVSNHAILIPASHNLNLASYNIIPASHILESITS